MHRVLSLGVLALVGLVLLVPADLAPAQSPDKSSATVVVKVNDGAQVWFDGTRTKKTGTMRKYQSPPLDRDKAYFYMVKAVWLDAQGKEQTREEKVRFKAGEEVTLDFTATEMASTSKGTELRSPDVPFVSTPQDVIEKMLELAAVKAGDVVYDLGCGDGRIVITAAKKYGAKGIGIDIDPACVKEALANVKKENVESLVTIREGDVLKTTSYPDATVVTLYMLPSFNRKVRPILEKDLKPGTRVICHDFGIEGWKTEREVRVKDNDGQGPKLFLYIIKEQTPEAKEPAKDTVKEELKKEEPKKEEPKKEEPKKEEPKKEVKIDVIYWPTPTNVVDKMLEMADVKKADVVYDLGCGDGRIVVTAAKKFGCKASGFDIDPERVKDSLKNVKDNKVGDLVTIKEQDVFKLDLTPASVITLYLLPELNVRLIPQLEKCKPGTRIVSHDFGMEGVKPDKVVTLKAKNHNDVEADHKIYLWTIPLKKEAEEKDKDKDNK